MPTTNTVVVVGMAVLMVLVTAWDLYATGGPHGINTISQELLAVAQRHPIVPFLGGVLFGHLLWPQQNQ